MTSLDKILAIGLIALSVGCDQSGGRTEYAIGEVRSFEGCLRDNASEVVSDETISEACLSKHQIYFDASTIGFGGSFYPVDGPVMFEGEIENTNPNIIVTEVRLSLVLVDNQGERKSWNYSFPNLWVEPKRSHELVVNALPAELLKDGKHTFCPHEFSRNEDYKDCYFYGLSTIFGLALGM